MRSHEIARQIPIGTREITEDALRPVPPARPNPEDCCGGGCNPCIFEQYEEAMERYEQALERWNARQRPP
jgi:hypothetical protein